MRLQKVQKCLDLSSGCRLLEESCEDGLRMKKGAKRGHRGKLDFRLNEESFEAK